jgi:hypothetical protein
LLFIPDFFRGAASSGPITAPRNPYTLRSAGYATSSTVRSWPGSKAHRGARGYVEPESPRCRTIERERRVRLEEVIVRADLHGPVAAVRHGDFHRLATSVDLDVAVVDELLARDHWMLKVLDCAR